MSVLRETDAAINDAADKLPEGVRISITLEHGSLTVELIDSVEELRDRGPVDGDESLGECIDRLVDAARFLAASAEQERIRTYHIRRPMRKYTTLSGTHMYGETITWCGAPITEFDIANSWKQSDFAGHVCCQKCIDAKKRAGR